MIKTDRPWPVKEFTKYLRMRLRLCGVGKDDVLMYSGQSLKRGCVQFDRSLGVRDEQIRELREVIELPLTNPELFVRVGIKVRSRCFDIIWHDVVTYF